MVEVEVANRSGVAVNEDEAVELVLRVLGEEAIDAGELGLAFVGGERELKREHLGSTRRRTCSRFRSTAATSFRPACRASSATYRLSRGRGRGLARPARPWSPAPARLRPRREMEAREEALRA